MATKVGRTYTRGLVLLFSGPSGTGKTLTANALASHLGMKVLLVNFNTVLETEKGTSSTVWVCLCGSVGRYHAFVRVCVNAIWFFVHAVRTT